MREELIELARKAGLDIPEDNPAYNLEFNLEELGVFVELVKEQQQSWIASLEAHARDADRMYKELETELAASQAQIKVLEQKMADDWCGCVGIHAHRLGVCTTCNKPVIGWWEVAKSAIEDLAASQAQIAELKDFAIWLTGCGYDFTQHPYFIEQRDRLLKKPHDNSALREMLAKERERSIIELHRNADKPIDEIVSAIRAMEKVK